MPARLEKPDGIDVLLLRLLRGPMCGTDIADFIEKKTQGGIKWDRDAVYYFGQIRKREVHPGNGSQGRKRTYRMTEKGPCYREKRPIRAEFRTRRKTTRLRSKYERNHETIKRLAGAALPSMISKYGKWLTEYGRKGPCFCAETVFFHILRHLKRQNRAPYDIGWKPPLRRSACGRKTEAPRMSRRWN